MKKILQNVFFEKRGFEGLFEDNPEADQILELIQSYERSSETMVDELWIDYSTCLSMHLIIYSDWLKFSLPPL